MEAPLVALLLLLSAVAVAAEPPPLLDTDGHEIHAAVEYYVTSITTGSGLTFQQIGKEACPSSVVQVQFNHLRGAPLTFHPVNPADDVVRESSDINVQFQAKSECNSTTTWQVDNANSGGDYKPSSRYPVKIGGSVGRPSIGTLSNWFKVQPVGPPELHAYKFVFCPTVCDICQVECRDVGLYSAKKTMRLSLVVDEAHDPLVVRFSKRPATVPGFINHGTQDL